MSSFSDYSQKGFKSVYPKWRASAKMLKLRFRLADPFTKKGDITGVRWNEKNTESVLRIAFDSQIAEFLFHSHFGDGVRRTPEKRAEAAWELVLAHEKGHMLMDQKCWLSGLDPNSESDRAKALRIERKGMVASRLDFHVRAAEEAFCDTMMLLEANEMFGNGWKEVGQVLSRIRRAYSERLPLHVGDRYSTWRAIDRMLEDGEIMDPFEAAKFAYEKSVEATGIGKSLAIAIASPFAREPQEIGERLIEMRQARAEEERFKPKSPESPGG